MRLLPGSQGESERGRFEVTQRDWAVMNDAEGGEDGEVAKGKEGRDKRHAHGNGEKERLGRGILERIFYGGMPYFLPIPFI